MQGYVDSDWVGVVDRRRYMSGYMLLFFGGVVSWMNSDKLWFLFPLLRKIIWKLPILVRRPFGL
jgi:hypothetical protein